MEPLYERDGISVRRMLKSDVDYLKDHLKKTDVEEIWASDHFTPKEALDLCVKESIACWTVCNGHPICSFGIYTTNILGDKATIWMLSTDDLKKIQKRFLKYSRSYVDMMLEFYPELTNFVDTRNKVTIRWLRWMKAEFEPPAPYGLDGKMFQKFTFKRC